MSNNINSFLNQIGSATHGDTLLFAGDIQDPVPRMLVYDTAVSPVALRVWLYLRTHVHDQLIAKRCPSYEEISQDLSIASHETISQAFMLLRARRWLTLAVRNKTASGKNIGNVYVMHTEPAGLSDTVGHDGEYLQLVEKMCCSTNKKIKDVGQSVKLSLENETDYFANNNLLTGRMFGNQSKKVAAAAEKADYGIRSGLLDSVLKPTTDSVVGSEIRSLCSRRSSSYSSTTNNGITDFSQSRLSEIKQQLKDAKSTLNKDLNNYQFYDDILMWGDLSKKAANKALSKVPTEWRQPTIDEVMLKVKAGDTVKNTIALLTWFCQQIEKGEMPLVNYLDQEAQKKKQAKKAQTDNQYKQFLEQSEKAAMDKLGLGAKAKS